MQKSKAPQINSCKNWGKNCYKNSGQNCGNKLQQKLWSKKVVKDCSKQDWTPFQSYAAGLGYNTLMLNNALLEMQIWVKLTKSEQIWANLSETEWSWAKLSKGSNYAQQRSAALSNVHLCSNTQNNLRCLEHRPEKQFLELPRTTSGS